MNGFKLALTVFGLALLQSGCEADANFFFPNARSPKGRMARATAVPVPAEEGEQSNMLPQLQIDTAEEDETAILKSLIDSVLYDDDSIIIESPSQGEPIMLQASEKVGYQEEDPNKKPDSPIFHIHKAVDPDDYIRKHAYERHHVPRNVEGRQGLPDFGSQMQASLENDPEVKFGSLLPQLAEFANPEPPAMNLLQLRQAETTTDNEASLTSLDDNSSDDEIRCIPKVMQVEETVYDRAIKCQHSYQEKCHMTYITDYRSTTEEKCQTTFKKNCHITFKPMPLNETVNVCHTPVVRKCGSEPVGPEICSTHYETNCETQYKTYEVEQDEPVCRMEVMTKCENVTLPFPNDPSVPRNGRQDDGDANPDESTPAPTPELVTLDPDNAPDTQSDTQSDTQNGPQGITVDQRCEEWPVQKCTLEKKTVKKVHPDTQCRKIPREVCVPNNCALVQADEICRDEVRMQVQNVPEEECELQPEENCHMEAVLVPRLVPQNNCVKVPKEICVNTKKNPRRVKKPVIKEWCYRPKDILENPGVLPAGIFEADNTDGTNNNVNF
ncbi:uncharacterized protein LOC131877386 [Tigriopus californicus]|uniref:uncharacterized protein LOC131877386 n=1 Tax=Tigriopus californicus TaxID=6832 RepID=UPI0027DA3ABF|nr:uncharacterized protein LOC131877386 [Tigriopus californicus]